MGAVPERTSKQSESQPTGNKMLQQGFEQTDNKIKTELVWRRERSEDGTSWRQGKEPGGLNEGRGSQLRARVTRREGGCTSWNGTEGLDLSRGSAIIG